MTGADLTSKVAVVTGARRGIGAAIADSLLGHGATVVLSGRDAEQVNAQVRDLEYVAAGRVQGCASDLTTEAGRVALLESAGTVDILVNNAGGFIRPGSTQDSTLHEWNEQLQVNLTVPFLLCQAALPGMVEQGWGRIINIGSIVAAAPQLGNAIGYVAAKSGLVGFTRQLAAEVAPHGVTANVISPGTVRTEHLKQYLAASDSVSESALAGSIPIGRLGDPEEIAGIVPYLTSKAGSFITGAVIDINGGAVRA